jgi:hypothetical protein
MDTNQQCFEGYHRVWALALGIPLLTLLLMVPVAVMLFLWLHRDNLEESYYLQHYGFLYTSYRLKRCWWEGALALQVSCTVFNHTVKRLCACGGLKPNIDFILCKRRHLRCSNQPKKLASRQATISSLSVLGPSWCCLAHAA